jgi:hypothetical protein
VLHKARLGEQDGDGGGVTGAEAVSLVTQLTRHCWALQGETIHPLDRGALPVRFVPWVALRREGE